MSERRQRNLGPTTGTERRKAPRRRDLSRALGGAVLQYEEERRAREELGRKNALLEEEKYTDSLTGLANDRSFREKFPELVDIAKNNGEPLALLFVDANDLHSLNKRLGHTAGNEVLKSIARTLKDITRPTDLVARSGGDEFVVALTGFKPVPGVSDSKLLEDTQSRFRSTLGEQAAVGIAILQPDETAEDLYARADTACTANKPSVSRL